MEKLYDSPFLSKDKSVRQKAHRELIKRLHEKGFKRPGDIEFKSVPEINPATIKDWTQYFEQMQLNLENLQKHAANIADLISDKRPEYYEHSNGQRIPLNSLMLATMLWPLDEVFTDLIDPLTKE